MSRLRSINQAREAWRERGYRRKTGPRVWSDARLDRSFVVAYSNGAFVHEAGYRAAVVYHQDRRHLPKALLKRSELGGVQSPPYMTFLLEVFAHPEFPDVFPPEVGMGWSSHLTETKARGAGRSWVGPGGYDVAPRDLPPTLLGDVRHGVRYPPPW